MGSGPSDLVCGLSQLADCVAPADRVQASQKWAVSRAEQMIRGASESVTVRLSLGCTRTGPGVDR